MELRLFLFGLALLAWPVSAQETAEERDRMLESIARSEALMHKILEKGEPFRQQEEEVQSRLTAACSNLYRRDADATITNPLCYEVFLNHGLPD